MPDLLRLPNLPYSKTDSVADLDAPRKRKPRKPVTPKSVVPVRDCALSKTCGLREHGCCSALHCQLAAAYESASPPVASSAKCSNCIAWSWDDKSRSGGHCHDLHKDGTWQSGPCPFHRPRQSSQHARPHAEARIADSVQANVGQNAKKGNPS